eukprot:CAMPEP_0115016588 /NCGR_PEP_ID=MMETSP0216-20121206/27543_1 /TAXON_ID=223996 /ORGANISM="Protocruzia adherens, Strain Boccale" /LENGTH=535 /DNA_ID=CAMNT_0002387107 /DNA_START=45 /DNA_END=1652 /DNA_ORIENTATION=-
MAELQNLDYLRMRDDRTIIRILEEEEEVILSLKLQKINRKGKVQDRILLITNLGIHNVVRSKVFFTESITSKRKIPFEEVCGVSVAKASFEFVLHCPNEYDYRYSSVRRENIISCVKHFRTRLGYGLPIVEIDIEDLKDVTTTRTDNKKGITRMPKSIADTCEIPINKKKSPSTSSSDSERKMNEEWEQETKTRARTIFSKRGQEVSIDDFNLLKVVGRGTFGKVMLVEKKDSKELFALKILRKDQLIDKEQIEHTRTEKMIMQKVDHPFLVGLEYAFQTPEKLFFVMPYVRGGELFQHLKQIRRFPEDRARFYAAEICTAIGHLHEQSIIYRDLKPENVLLDQQGHVKLTDFGMSKQLSDDERTNSFCGTPEYLAPEIITAKGHSLSADWWSFGILLYEMLLGIPPFYNKNNQVLYDLIRFAELKFPTKYKVSEPAQDLIRKLLNRNPEKRISYEAIKEHPFFASINWGKLDKMEIDPPYVPDLENELDTKYFDEEFTSEEAISTMVPRQNLEVIMEHQNEFQGFTFIPQNNLA